MTKKSIKTLNLKELENLVKDLKQPSFRTNQLVEWIYQKDLHNFSQMTNLPKSMIEDLSKNFVITHPTCINRAESNDGSVKYVLEFKTDGENHAIRIECVAIPSIIENSNQLTVCLSSQAGCAMGCVFCATGQQGFKRNLYMSEILDQINFIKNDLNKDVSNIVVMGQGEPFNNFNNLIDALELINNKRIFNIGARKITVSTCGILNGIEKFGSINKQYVLAVSLHSAIQETRNKIMPGVKSFTLDRLKQSLIKYQEESKRRITFEYIILDGINNSEKDLNNLIKFCKGLKCHINIIKFNKIPNSDFYSPSKEKINEFVKRLTDSGIETTIRNSRGSDIAAACGQLLNNTNN